MSFCNMRGAGRCLRVAGRCMRGARYELQNARVNSAVRKELGIKKTFQ